VLARKSRKRCINLAVCVGIEHPDLQAAKAGSFVWTLQHMTIITLTLGLMVTLGSVFITGIVASRHQLKYESFGQRASFVKALPGTSVS
jgi:hypothetical protein